jgi:hypothetical protein
MTGLTSPRDFNAKVSPVVSLMMRLLSKSMVASSPVLKLST